VAHPAAASAAHCAVFESLIMVMTRHLHSMSDELLAAVMGGQYAVAQRKDATLPRLDALAILTHLREHGAEDMCLAVMTQAIH
jgi:hypothetical protein